MLRHWSQLVPNMSTDIRRGQRYLSVPAYRLAQSENGERRSRRRVSSRLSVTGTVQPKDAVSPPNCKRWFTTSILWRKVPESDARSLSVLPPAPRTFCPVPPTHPNTPFFYGLTDSRPTAVTPPPCTPLR